MNDEAQRRKNQPLFSGVLAYFPDALLAVAELSRIGNEQHNPGKPLHWDRSKSTDEPDALARHLLQRGTRDTDGVRHSAKVAWRALAMLQKELEAEKSATPMVHLAADPSTDLETVVEAFKMAARPSLGIDVAQRPDENAAQHRARVNAPWPSHDEAWPRGRYARQPDDFARGTADDLAAFVSPRLLDRRAPAAGRRYGDRGPAPIDDGGAE